MSEQAPVLYSFRRCPYAMRARLAIAVSGLSCELREVALRDKPAAMVAASPKATVPVLVLADGSVIDESLAIMTWALERDDPPRWLEPDDDSRATMLARIAHCDGPFKQALDRYKYPSRYMPVAQDAELGVVLQADKDDQQARYRRFALPHRSACGAFIDALEQRLMGRPWLGGSAVSLSDAAIMPFVRQFAGVETAWFDAQPWPRVQQWLARLSATPLFATVMLRTATWQVGAPGVRFPPG